MIISRIPCTYHTGKLDSVSRYGSIYLQSRLTRVWTIILSQPTEKKIMLKKVEVTLMEGSLVKKGRCYYLVISKKDNNGKYRTDWINTHCEGKTDAEKEKRKILNQMENNLFLKYEKITFSDFIENWLENEMKIKIEETTYHSYRNIIINHIKPHFKDLLLQKLQPINLQEYYNKLIKQGFSANTVHRHHANIHKALKFALKMGMVARNVSDAVELPKRVRFKPSTYNKEQFDKLFDAIKGTYIETPILISAYMGLRRGEVLGLQWKNVNLENSVMQIKVSRTRISKDEIIKGTKNSSSERELYIPQEILKHLKELKGRQIENKELFGTGYYDNDYVCCRVDGSPLGISYVTQKLRSILKNNNLKPIRFHDVRHSYATILYENGVSLKDLSDQLGHCNINITADTYTHPTMETKKRTANKANEIFSNSNCFTHSF